MADRTVTYRFLGSFQGLTAGLTAAGKSVNDLGVKLTALDRNGAKMRAGLNSVGDTAGKVGLIAAAGLGAVIAVTAKFDKAMSAVQAATGETAANMEKLRDAAIQAGADTAYSATEAAGAIEELAKAGVSTADIVSGGLAGSLDLAAAGALDVGKAAEISATAMTQFKLQGSDVTHIADLLAAGAGKAQGSVEDLGMALSQSGLVASQVGLSLEETTGGLAAFASAGLLGSDAGTSFKTMLGALTPNSKEAATLMDSLGISAYDAQGNFVGLAEFAGNLRGELQHMTDQQRQSTLETIFGSDAVRAASVLYEQGADGIESWINKTNDAGFAADTAATRLDNLSGDFEKLKGSLETALIGSGEGAQGPLRSLVQNLTGAVDAFNDLPPAAKNTATALAGITAITGGGLFFGAKVVTGIADAKSALNDLGLGAGRARGALKAASSAATVAAAAFAGLAVIDQLQVGAADALPGVEALSASLINLAKNGGGNLPEEFDNLGASIDRLANPNRAQALQDNISDAIGGIGGGSELKNARAEIEALDGALTNLVSAGGPDVAKAAFEGIGQSAGLTKTELASLSSLLPSYKDALAGAANQATLADAATNGLSEATGGLTSAMGASAETSAEFLEQQKAAAKQLQDARDAAVETATGFFNLGASLNDSKVSLGDWIGQLEEQANALRDFRRNAVEAADKGLREGLIAALQEAGPEGAMRLAQLADATEAEIGRANRAWNQGQKEINKYTDSVVGVPDAKGTTVTANTGRATAAIDAVKRILGIVDNTTATPSVNAQTSAAMNAIRAIFGQMDNLDGKTATVTVYRRIAGASIPGVSEIAKAAVRATGQADGGSVPKDGGSYADRYLYMLAPGEEIISNRHGQADQFRADRAAGRIPGYADGGTTGRRPRGDDVLGYGDSQREMSRLLRDWADDGGRGKRGQVDFLKDFAQNARRALRGLERSVDDAKSAVDQNKDALERETGARDDLLSAFGSVVTSISGQFRSDLFAAPDNVFRSSGADPISRLRADIAASDRFSGLYAGLQARGAGGASLAYAAEQGEGALAQLQAFTDDQLREYGELFAAREQRATAAGTQVAQAQLGQELAQSNAYLAQIEQRLAVAEANSAELIRQQGLQTKVVEAAGNVVAAEQKKMSSSAARGQRNRRQRKN